MRRLPGSTPHRTAKVCGFSFHMVLGAGSLEMLGEGDVGSWFA
jgi:hypothetical protein